MKVLFKNPKAAALYAGITLFGAAIAVGTTDSPGSLQSTVDTLGGPSSQDRAAERKFGEGMLGGNQRRKEAEEDDAAIEFATDEELIVDATGFDPTPDEDFSGFDASPASERPLLSDQDKRRAKEAEFGGWGSEN